MEPIILSIDGNIGSGKSTFLNKLKILYPNFHYIDEPVDCWMQFTNDEGESLLEVFYKDKKRWSYTFQNCAFLTRARAINKSIKEWRQKCLSNPEECKNNIFITERCVETDYNVFAKMLHEDKYLDKMEWDIYRQWYRFLSVECKISGIIYITCSPEKCSQRIGIRSRVGEDLIPLEYLTQLHKYHESWIGNTHIPVLNICSEDDKKYGDYDYVNNLEKFINTL